MEITKERTNHTLSIALSGHLDALAAEDLSQIVHTELDDIEYLIFDMKNLSYIASAGLRVLLSAHKIMSKKGSMKLTHVNGEVKDVLDVTGLLRFLAIEE